MPDLTFDTSLKESVIDALVWNEAPLVVLHLSATNTVIKANAYALQLTGMYLVGLPLEQVFIDVSPEPTVWNLHELTEATTPTRLHEATSSGMLADLNAAAAGTVVVLHACCHNPTGYDITPAQWDQVIAVVKAKHLVPFLDMAYQGFGYGLKEDGAVIGKFVAAGLLFFVATSFSKSFSLYGERVGALSVVCANKEEAARVLSQLKIVIRTNYSNPPTHGGAIVTTVLNTPELRAQWEAELGEMRVRIKAMRQKLVDGLKAAGVKQDMSFITQQIGMFSYSGLSKDQMVRLRNEFGVYGTDTGRMCVAALNSKNIDYVCASIAKVI